MMTIHFLINYVFSPPFSSLFIIDESVIRTSTQNMCTFVCCLWERNWIIYTNCVMCLRKKMLAQIFPFKEASCWKLKDMNELFSKNFKFVSIFELETLS
jgi:acetone carboxylase gamma subunit